LNAHWFEPLSLINKVKKTWFFKICFFKRVKTCTAYSEARKRLNAVAKAADRVTYQPLNVEMDAAGRCTS
jgi:hypothetical protein